MNTKKFCRHCSISSILVIAFVGLNTVPGPAHVMGASGHEYELTTISGRLVAGTHYPADRIVELRIDGSGKRAVQHAYTDGVGAFVFRDVPLVRDQIYYIVVELEGFKPYQERVDELLLLSGPLTIFLESLDTTTAARAGGPYVVDVRQLQARIPKKAVEQYKKSLEESSKGKVKKAVERLKRAIELAPDFYEAHNSLGAQYLKLGEYRPAELALLKASELNPHAADPVINLGILYYEQSETARTNGRIDEARDGFQKAVEFLQSAVRHDPMSGSAHYFLGAALYKSGAYERAETMLHRALELDAGLHDARVMLFNVYTKQHRFNEALLELRTYLEKNPNSPLRPTLERIEKQVEQVLNP